MRPVNRIIPKLPVQSYKTYSVLAPPETHFRVGSCEEAECLAYQFGWTTRVDETTKLGAEQAGYIRTIAARGYVESKTDGGLTAFEFFPGQKCFERHLIRLDREAVFAVKRGDWRGTIGTPTVHRSPDDWLEDFADHQQRLAQGQA